MHSSVVRCSARAVMLSLVLSFVAGCGSPPPPPRSAKGDIKEAEDAMEAGALMYKRQQYVVAQTFYETALNKIADGESYAKGIELTHLHDLKEDARAKKIDCDSMALAHPQRAKPAASAEPKAGVAVLSEAARKEAEEKKAAEAQRKSLDSVATALPAQTPKKPEAGDDTDPDKDKKSAKPEAKAGGDDAKPVVKKDKNGIYPEITGASSALQIVKLMQKGKFVVAYAQLYNKSPDGKRISVAVFFKNRDNQETIPARTVACFPYEHFSTNVQDLIADQSVHNLTANSDEVVGNSEFQFVCVGEANTDELAKQVVKAYVVVSYSDGTSAETTGPENSPANAIPALKLK